MVEQSDYELSTRFNCPSEGVRSEVISNELLTLLINISHLGMQERFEQAPIQVGHLTQHYNNRWEKCLLGLFVALPTHCCSFLDELVIFKNALPAIQKFLGDFVVSGLECR